MATNSYCEKCGELTIHCYGECARCRNLEREEQERIQALDLSHLSVTERLERLESIVFDLQKANRGWRG